MLGTISSCESGSSSGTDASSRASASSQSLVAEMTMQPSCWQRALLSDGHPRPPHDHRRYPTDLREATRRNSAVLPPARLLLAPSVT